MSRSPLKFFQKTSLIAVLALGGCESLPTLTEMIPALPSLPGLGALPDFNVWDRWAGARTCATVDEADVRQVNWTRVPEVNMRVRDGEFEPMIVQLKQGWPYIFHIRNRDDSTRTFAADDFFAKMALVRITIDGKRQDETCVAKIKIPAGKSAELRLVAARDGRYEFEDTVVPVVGLFSQGASGLIIVEERFGVRYQ
jgi:uncharacterized cupredoxin-like copper-binding protein